MFEITTVIVMSGMGLAEELALTDEAMALIIRALKELQTSKRVFHVFFEITICKQTQEIAGNPQIFSSLSYHCVSVRMMCTIGGVGM